MTEDIKNAIKKTIDAVKDTPEPYQKIAFQVVLQHLLTNQAPHKEHTSTKKHEDVKEGEKRDITKILKAEYDWSSTGIREMSSLGQSLSILRIAKDEFGLDGLSATDVLRILNEKFRLTKTINTISMSLMGAVGKYLDRIRVGNEYIYRITAAGREQLESMINKKVQ